jgi:secondary thiamine-phosphate synthase enzyme
LIEKIDIKTSSRIQFMDITATIRKIVGESGVERGVCHVYSPHTTAGIIVNEHADPSVVADLAAQLDKVAPQHENYRHTEGNSPAHIKATLTGTSATLFIEQGALVLGTWQGIFLGEFDGPRSRQVLVKIRPD